MSSWNFVLSLVEHKKFYKLGAWAFRRRNMVYRVYFKPTKYILMGFVFAFYDLIILYFLIVQQLKFLWHIQNIRSK